MTEYTPTTEEVRLAAETTTLDESTLPGGEFDRWLNEIRAEAWDEGYQEANSDLWREGGREGNPYRPNEK